MERQNKYGEEAGRHYDQGLEDFARSGKGKPAAESARRSVDTPKGERAYEKAVDRGRAKPTDRER